MNSILYSVRSFPSTALEGVESLWVLSGLEMLSILTFINTFKRHLMSEYFNY